MKYEKYIGEEGDTYIICEMCSPKSEDDMLIDIMSDTYGDFECSCCGCHWDEESRDWM